MSDGRLQEKIPQRQLHQVGFPHQGDEPHHHDGVAAHFEEIIEAPDALDFQNTGEQRRQFLLQFGLWHGKSLVFLSLLRIGQRLAIHLAVGGQRDFREPDPGLRDHVFGNLRGQKRFQVFRLGSVVGIHRHHVGDQSLGFPVLAVSRRRRRPDLRMPAKGGFDLAQFDAVAVDLDLKILASEELDHAVGKIAADVPRLVEPLARAGMHDEFFGRLLRIAPIFLGQADAADIQIARHPDGRGVEVLVQDVHGLVAQWTTVRHARPSGIDLVDGIVDRPDGGFGGAAETVQFDVRILRPDLAGQIERDPISAEHDQPQAIQRRTGSGCGVFHQHGHQGGHRVPERNLVTLDQFLPMGRIFLGVGIGNDQRATHRQQPEDVVNRQVEIQRRQRQHPILLADAEPFVDVENGVDRAPVIDDDPFGKSRGAGGINQISDVFGTLRRTRNELGTGRNLIVRHDDPGRGVVPCQPRRCVFGRHDSHRLTLRQQPFASLIGKPRRDGHVGGPGQHDAHGRDDLLPTLVHDDGDQFVGPSASLAQKMGKPAGASEQLRVGQRLAGSNDGETVLVRFQSGQEKFRQGHGGDRRCSGIHLGALADLPFRDLRGYRAVPAARVFGQEPQQGAIGGEHVVQQSGRKQPFHRVPVEGQGSVFLEDLVIQPNLWCLADAVDLFAQPGHGDLLRHPRIQGQGTGEHHRHPGPADPALLHQIALDLDAPHQPVIEIVPKLALQDPDLILEGALAGEIRLQQRDRGEIAEDVVDFRVNRQAVKQGQVDGETRFLDPVVQNRREHAQGHGRGRGPCLTRSRLQAFPMGPFQTAAATGEHRFDDGFR